MLLYFEKGPKFQNFAYFTNCYFSSNIDVFSFVERIVVRAFGSIVVFSCTFQICEILESGSLFEIKQQQMFNGPPITH
jgi:hypothetical protein